MKTNTKTKLNAVPSGRSASCCSPAFLKARVESAAELYREGKVTRAECFRVELDEAHGENTGKLELEDNDDHKFMMAGEGEDHDEYRRREEISPHNLTAK